MHTWNTIVKTDTGKFTKALFILETLCEDQSISVLEYLRASRKASFLDLSLATSLDSFVLEEQLQKLCETGVVIQQEHITGSIYFLDYERIAKVNAIAGKLSHRIFR